MSDGNVGPHVVVMLNDDDSMDIVSNLPSGEYTLDALLSAAVDVGQKLGVAPQELAKAVLEMWFDEKIGD